MAATTQPPTAQLLTAEDLLRMPNGERYELVRGVLRKIPTASFRHGEIAGNFGAALGVYVRANKLGRVGMGDPGFLLVSRTDSSL